MSTDTILTQAIINQSRINISNIKDTFIVDTSFNLNAISNNNQLPLSTEKFIKSFFIEYWPSHKSFHTNIS